MTMHEYLEACKRRAYEIKGIHPNTIHSKRLDLAAQDMSFAHYTALQNMYKLLGPDVAPSRIAIVAAGGDPKASPLRPVDVQVGIPWGKAAPGAASPTSSSLPATAAVPTMTEQDVRAVIERCWELTRFGLGATRDQIRDHGSYGKALAAGHEELVVHLDECNKALQFMAQMDRRKTINQKAGSSYGLKHSAEHFLCRLKTPPLNTYVSNGALICAALHLGFECKPIRPGSPNAHFNISMRSPAIEWRQLDDRAESIYQPRARGRYNQLKEMLGVAY